MNGQKNKGYEATRVLPDLLILIIDNIDYTYMDLAYKEAIKSNCLNLPNLFVDAVIIKIIKY